MNRISGITIRFSLYLLYELLISAWVVYVWTHFEGIPLKEQFHDVHPVQHAQEVHFLVSALLYLIVVALAYRNRMTIEFRIYFPILCCLLWGTNRELDGVWERYEWDVLYDSLKFLTAIPGIVFVVIHRRSCWEGFLEVRSTPGFRFLAVGFIGYLMAQIVGEAQEALQVSRNYERATEESLELLFGACFVFSGVETLLQIARAMNKKGAVTPA